MSSMELLSLVVGDEQAAYNIMSACDNSIKTLASKYPGDLSCVPGMTKQKASLLMAMLELGRRKTTETMSEGRKMFISSVDVASYLQELIGDNAHEVFVVMFLNRSNRSLGHRIVSEGGITGTVADPRLILKHAVNINAVSLILSHNHPSGSLKPSKADEELTHKIKEAAKYFDIKVLDHVIVSQEGYYSFADEGIL